MNTIYPNKAAAQEALNKAVAAIKEIRNKHSVSICTDSEYHGADFCVNFYNENDGIDFVAVSVDD